MIVAVIVMPMFLMSVIIMSMIMMVMFVERRFDLALRKSASGFLIHDEQGACLSQGIECLGEHSLLFRGSGGMFETEEIVGGRYEMQLQFAIIDGDIQSGNAVFMATVLTLGACDDGGRDEHGRENDQLFDGHGSLPRYGSR